MLFDGLTVLQHRGQDAAGIVTSEHRRLHLRKDNGLVKDVFQHHHMLELRGHLGIGHCRYPTAGTSSCAEAQPLYTNYPHGICVAHNGNLTNAEELTEYMAERGRHVNTDSDSELLLNLFAEELTNHKAKLAGENGKNGDTANIQVAIFDAMTSVMKRCKGGYAGLFLINGVGLVGFRDPNGIRPLVFGCKRRQTTVLDTFDEDGVPLTPKHMEVAHQMLDYVMSSESVAIDTLGFKLVRYVQHNSDYPLGVTVAVF
jgi:amidophosphoribosyltransferase